MTIAGNITAQELGAKLGKCRKTILRWARDEWIPCMRVGKRNVLFDEVEVRKAMKNWKRD